MSGAFLTDKNKIHIASRFYKISSVSQLATLLNYIERNIYKEKLKTKKLTAKDLHYLSITKDSRYYEFLIKKKNGNNRVINTPDEYLKRVQSLINILLQILFEPKAHYSNNGFLVNRNICRNATPHINKKYVLNLDIKDFFPSINFRRTKTVLSLSPFNLENEKETLAFVVANLCTYKNSLPQGAPTSPIISNIVTQRLDRKLSKLSKSQKIKYTRYADDISFSSNTNVLKGEFIGAINAIVQSEGFKINASKTRLRDSRNRQLVTGLVVNEKLNVKREFIQTCRAMLNNWDKGGLDYAKSQYEKHNDNLKKSDFLCVLKGNISFIGQVRGRNDKLYQKLLYKYEYLNNKIDYSFIGYDSVQKRLVADNKKMELILLDEIHSLDDKFIAFSTSAFHQIENLLNYYYYLKFPDISDLLDFLMEHNPVFKGQHKKKESLNKFKTIRDLNINYLEYVFEKEHYYDKKIYYNNEIKILRDIRNDESHRCQIIDLNQDKVIAEYEQIKLKWEKFRKKKNREPEKQANEKTIEYNYRLLMFIKERNYKKVRKILQDVGKKVAAYCG